MIEHSRWIPQTTLAELDVFAGREFGRIYRVVPSRGEELTALPDLSDKSNEELAQLLLSPNGTQRDLAHQMLVWREPREVTATLAGVVQDATLPQSKIQALAVLDALRSLEPESQSTERRQQVIDQRPGMGPAIIGLLTQDFRVGDTATQYQRMPWIWRVSLAVGRRNDGGEIRDLLELSLTQGDNPLDHWQAVVVGGGIINGLTQVGQWPAKRITEILAGATTLRPRWQQTLRLAAVMADNPEVRAGTRYDALRIVALADPATAKPHLQKYLVKGADRQLQMGAVSGLADIESPAVVGPLLESLAFLKNRNSELAIEGLLRTAAGCEALERAILNDEHRIEPSELQSLLGHPSTTISGNAARLIKTLRRP